jgi:electron transfer flavoprotein beta subunit
MLANRVCAALVLRADQGGRLLVKIVVCVKQVPDSWAEKSLGADHTLDRESVDAVMNELDEYAVEEALRLQETHGGEVVVLSMGPSQATDTIRKALSMGADAAVHVSDAGLAGSDALGTSLALAKAIESRQADLVIFGSESTDARMSVIPAMVAQRLGMPQMTFANSVSVEANTITTNRVTEYGHDVVQATLPAVVSVVEKINEPRYPSFKGIMAAKKKPVETVDLAGLGIDAGAVGLAGSRTLVESAAARPPKAKGAIVVDDGNGGTAIADFLSAQKFI